MRFKQRKELADKYKEWVKQSIDNNQTMILDCAESLLAWLDINGYLNEVVRCKDCAYHYPPFDDCCRVDYVCEDDDFCSWGERREDGEI